MFCPVYCACAGPLQQYTDDVHCLYFIEGTSMQFRPGNRKQATVFRDVPHLGGLPTPPWGTNPKAAARTRLYVVLELSDVRGLFIHAKTKTSELSPTLACRLFRCSGRLQTCLDSTFIFFARQTRYEV